MGLFGGSRQYRVSCFGKLPFFSDFIEPVHRTGFGSELREWLQGAVGHQDAHRINERALPLVYRFAWPLHGGREVLVGVLWSSADAVGRWFPFCLYTEIPVKKLGLAALEELPVALAPIWEELQGLAVHADGRSWTEIGPGEASQAEVQKRLLDFRLEVGPDRQHGVTLDQALEAYEALDYLERLFTASFWVFYPRAAWSLVDLGRTLAEVPTAALGVRLPASESISQVVQAGFWLRSLRCLSGEGFTRLPTLFLPLRSESERGVLVLFRDPLPHDLQVLFGNLGGHDYLTDLRRLELPDVEPRGLDDFVELLQKKLARHIRALGLASLDLGELRRAAEA